MKFDKVIWIAWFNERLSGQQSKLMRLCFTLCSLLSVVGLVAAEAPQGFNAGFRNVSALNAESMSSSSSISCEL
tara:strand:+ start:861 stop:1082 length:222 start_codon:yes stop_codon:yes gene_type:complete